MLKPLLPNRHPDKDFFICDLGNVIPKSDIASMEHPLFTLSKKPDLKIKTYDNKDSKIQIIPSVLGAATIFDKDVLIYCVSQLMASLNKGKKTSKRLKFRAYDSLVSVNRNTGGSDHKRLSEAFSRLAGTLIKTNIRTNGKLIEDQFHILDSVRIIRPPEDDKGKVLEVEVVLSDWLYNSVIGEEVLSINYQYFRLRKPIERRIYEIARKHCGTQKKWSIGLDKLRKKVGSTGNIRLFRQTIRKIEKHNHIPDYASSARTFSFWLIDAVM